MSDADDSSHILSRRSHITADLIEGDVVASMGNSAMTDSEAEAFVLGLLRDRGILSTMEIEVMAREHNKRCPDQTVLFLSKMKLKGLIEGRVSTEQKGWVWSLPDRR